MPQSSCPTDAPQWRAALVGPDLLEVQRGTDSCVLPLVYDASTRSRCVFASEAESPWFPDLAAQLRRLLPALPGRFSVV